MADRFGFDDYWPPSASVASSTRHGGWPTLHPIVDATFRANPRYELVEFSRLPEALRVTLRPLTRDPEFFGVLRPRVDHNLPLKSVCRNTALLFLALGEAGPIPAYLREHSTDANRAVAELVGDAVLEIEVKGTFICGGDASKVIYSSKLPISRNRLAVLSLEAVKYGEALHIDDTRRLSARLYCYNRRPRSPSWSRRFQSDEQVMQHLGILASGRVAECLERHWTLDQTNDGWYAWRWARQRQGWMRDANYKLYLSPTPDATRTAFETFVEVMTDVEGPCFKVGKGLEGLLRPDKIVAYFQDYEEVAKAAERLQKSILDCPAQGVPFTAAVGTDGLISWGMDPPVDDFVLPWQRPESWRVWITTRLAEALVQSSCMPSRTVESWEYAMRRISLAGVDPATWVPLPTIWRH